MWIEIGRWGVEGCGVDRTVRRRTRSGATARGERFEPIAHSLNMKFRRPLPQRREGLAGRKGSLAFVRSAGEKHTVLSTLYGVYR